MLKRNVICKAVVDLDGSDYSCAESSMLRPHERRHSSLGFSFGSIRDCLILSNHYVIFVSLWECGVEKTGVH